MFAKDPLHERRFHPSQELRKTKGTQVLNRLSEGVVRPIVEAENGSEAFPSIGRQLLTKLLATAKELQGRVVGRNNDDVCILLNGLEILSREWNTMEQDLHLSQNRPNDENSPPLNGFRPVSHHQSPAQNRNYTEAVAQARRLEDELDEIKAKWEHALSSTVDQQVALHRQRLKDRETLIAQQEAELARLRSSQVQSPVENGRLALQPDRISSQGRSTPRYTMSGRVEVGQTLQIDASNGANSDDLAYQWYQVLRAEEWIAISGATRQQYSPEPYDCGCTIGCYVLPQNSTNPKAGFKVVSPKCVGISKVFLQWVGEMYDNGGASFGVIVIQRNGILRTNREICTLEVHRQHMTLHMHESGSIQQKYSSDMQVCGARGHGTAAAQGVFLALKAMRGQDVFMLACETAKDRNACILLLRKMAALQGHDLKGPE